MKEALLIAVFEGADTRLSWNKEVFSELSGQDSSRS
jgi:hypothetical protein